MSGLESAAIAYADAVALQGAARVELHLSRESAKAMRISCLASIDVHRRRLTYHRATRAVRDASAALVREARRAVQ